MPPIKSVVVLGGGSAGYLAALTLRSRLPNVQVTIVRSENIPVIGVGESTTRALPLFLHDFLGISRQEFFREVHPIWKHGIRFEWGRKDRTHFNYPFDSFTNVPIAQLPRISGFYSMVDAENASLLNVLLENQLSAIAKQNGGGFVMDESGGYHIENRRFLRYLEKKGKEIGVKQIIGEVVEVLQTESGDISALRLADEQCVLGDFFVDCSGFRSLLLGQTMQVPFVSYEDTLYCDRALVGSWERSDDVRPFTTAETMNNGWCWRIDFEKQVTRGYVYSSQFCDEEEAMQEMRQKNPLLGELRSLKFPRGRYENFWVKNVAAVGNASGFVEPLEATALHLIIEQARVLYRAIADTGGVVPAAVRQVENERYREQWDDVRDFLALHYKFNEHRDTEFWKYCREETDLRAAAPILSYFREAGPSPLLNPLIPRHSIFGLEGYMTMLIGLGVETHFEFNPSDQERKDWKRYQEYNRQRGMLHLPMDKALALVYQNQN